MKKVIIISTDSMTGTIEITKAMFSKGVDSPQQEILTLIDRITSVDQLEEQPEVLHDEGKKLARVITRRFKSSGMILTDLILDKEYLDVLK